MLLNLQKSMTIHMANKTKFEVAAHDPVEMDPAGLTVVHRNEGKARFYSWAAVTYIEQDVI